MVGCLFATVNKISRSKLTDSIFLRKSAESAGKQRKLPQIARISSEIFKSKSE